MKNDDTLCCTSSKYMFVAFNRSGQALIIPKNDFILENIQRSFFAEPCVSFFISFFLKCQVAELYDERSHHCKTWKQMN